MRCMERNKTLIYYAPMLGTTPIMDGDDDTFEHDVSFGEKTALYANVSPAIGFTYRGSGQAESEWFGRIERYDKQIIIEGECPFKEPAGLWIDDLDAPNPDYQVQSIAQSANFAKVLVKKIV